MQFVCLPWWGMEGGGRGVRFRRTFNRCYTMTAHLDEFTVDSVTIDKFAAFAKCSSVSSVDRMDGRLVVVVIVVVVTDRISNEGILSVSSEASLVWLCWEWIMMSTVALICILCVYLASYGINEWQIWIVTHIIPHMHDM